MEAYVQWCYQVLLNQFEITVYFQLEWSRRVEGQCLYDISSSSSSGGSDYISLATAIRRRRQLSDLTWSDQMSDVTAEERSGESQAHQGEGQGMEGDPTQPSWPPRGQLVPDSVPMDPPQENELQPQPQRPTQSLDLEDMGIQAIREEMVDLGAFRQPQPQLMESEGQKVSPEVGEGSADEGDRDGHEAGDDDGDGAKDGGRKSSEVVVDPDEDAGEVEPRDLGDDWDWDLSIFGVERWAQSRISEIRRKIHYAFVKTKYSLRLARELGFFKDKGEASTFIGDTLCRLDRLQAMDRRRMKLMPKPQRSYSQVMLLGSQVWQMNKGPGWSVPTRLVD